ncbi:MAG TPA: PEGA domain-containing protein [Nannocystaceae bacterium]|nr:PEGA domain-containing protein [Nannocystaceae bacterium]
MTATARVGAAAVAVALALGGARAHAQEPTVEREIVATTAAPRVFVGPLAIEGALPKPVQQELEERLREGLAKPGLDLVDDAASATHVVRATVEVADRDLRFRIELREKDGDVVAHVEDLCELCGRTEAADTLTSLGLSLRRRVEIALRPPPVVAVVSEPPGAFVQLDGEPFGTTPIELPVAAGKHTLRVTKAGFIAQTRTIDVVSGVRESLHVALQTIPGEAAPQRRPVRWAIGWAALSAGAVGTLSGVTLLAIDGRPIRSKCKGSGVDADGTCRFVHSTLVSGAVLGALGVGLLATGIALVVIEKRRAPAARERDRGRHARLGLGPLGPALRF